MSIMTNPIRKPAKAITTPTGLSGVPSSLCLPSDHLLAIRSPPQNDKKRVTSANAEKKSDCRTEKRMPNTMLARIRTRPRAVADIFLFNFHSLKPFYLPSISK